MPEGWSKKRERQYEHIKDGLEERGESEDTAQEIAARTGVSINTALGRMRYALVNLRKKITANARLYDTNLTLFDPPAVRLQRIAS